MTNPDSWLCVQTGAREHYAVPRLLEGQGLLRRLYTDLWMPGWLAGPLAWAGGRKGRQLAARRHPDLPSGKVTSWPGAVLTGRARGQGESVYDHYVAEGVWLSGQAVRHAVKHEARGPLSGVFSYDTTAREIFEWIKPQGGRRILGQMDPGQVEADLVAVETRRWPGWQDAAGEVPAAYRQRREAEWELADTVVVNSNFCRTALLEQGVPAARLAVVPLCYEAELPAAPFRGRTRTDGLRVLFLGQVNLRKGIQYLMEAARLLQGRPIQFTVAGQLQISPAARATAPDNLRFIGPVPRAEVPQCYAEADVFVLPTLSDGFAITQIEAMAWGLPVIATLHCGEVVRDGLDGLIVPAADPAALAAAFSRFLDDRPFLEESSRQALERAAAFSPSRILPQWLKVLGGKAETRDLRAES